MRHFSAIGTIYALTAILLCVVFKPVQAQIIIGGSESAAAYPFGGNFAYTGEYQQIYNSRIFATPFSIGAINFASSSLFSQPDVGFYDVVIGLSSTSASLDNPSSIFANNKGANYTTVFSGTVTAFLSATDEFDLNIPLDQTFQYDPAEGNLLMDVVVNSANTQQTDYFVSSNESPDVARVFNAGGDGDPTVQTESGLLTRFDAAPVPETGTLLCLGLLLVGGAFACRRPRPRPTTPLRGHIP